MENLYERAASLLKGSYDLHAHSSPSHIRRSVNDAELLCQASAAGMAGILIKNHYESTAGRAALLNQAGGLSAKAYGGLVLNQPAGGINPYAAESALRLGASFIWLPTRDAAHCLRLGHMPGDFFKRPGISILDCEGKLIPAVYDVLEVIKKYDAVLATGHVSVSESLAACRAARDMGVKTVLTHPEWLRLKIPVPVQQSMANMGVIIEKNWANVEDGDCSGAAMAESIRALGCSRVFISSDRGQYGHEGPVEGMLRFITLLLNHGFSESEIRIMARENPQLLLSH